MKKTRKRKANEAKTIAPAFRNFLHELFAAQFAADEELHAALHRDYMRASSQLLPRVQRQHAAKQVRTVLEVWRDRNRDGDPDANAWRKRQRSVNREIKPILVKSFTLYRNWQTLRAQYLKVQKAASSARLKAALRAQKPLDWRIATPVTPTHQVRYTAAFTLVDQVFENHNNPGYVRENRSSANQHGYLIHDVELSDDPFTWPVWGLASRNNLYSAVSCGVTHRMRRTGRLHIAVELESWLGHGYITLRDRIGLSDAFVEVTLSLDVSVQRSNGEVIHMPRILFRETALSDGKDREIYLPELEPLYQWSRTTSAVIPQDEQLTIHVTPTLTVLSIIDDMTTHVKLQFAWQLNSIVTGVV